MSRSDGNEIISRISPAAPVNLDELLCGVEGTTQAPGRYIFPREVQDIDLVVPLKDEEVVCFGARVTEDTPNVVALAMSVAQLAAEKNAEPVVFSHVDNPGLSRFGFRIERIVANDDQDVSASEGQIKAFWGIVMVI